MDLNETIKINKQAPNFNVDILDANNEVKKLNLNELKGKWTVLFFYPADFTFICPTELGDLADSYETLRNMNTEVISVSTDTTFVHKAWKDNSPTIAKIKFPMAADTTGSLCKNYGTYIADEGLSLRGTFIIDPDGVLKAFEMHDNSIGRKTSELIRKVQALQYVREHEGEVAPCNWEPGKGTLKPGMDLVGKL